jgi:hypothetical protein
VSLPVRRGGEGFSDSLSVDFVDPEGGRAALVLVEVRPGARRAQAVELVIDPGVATAGEVAKMVAPELHGEVLFDWGAIELGEVRWIDDGERARISATNEAGELDLEATRLGGATLEAGSAFTDATGMSHEAFAARVTGEWRPRRVESRRIEGLGRIVRTSGEPAWERIELLRFFTAVTEDGSLLVVASARTRGARGHGEEATSAVLLDAEQSLTRFEEPLLSTEYDAAGTHRRAGIELWGPDDAAPLRGAGTRIGGPAGAGGLDSAFLRFTLNGSPGTARYDLVRAAD